MGNKTTEYLDFIPLDTPNRKTTIWDVVRKDNPVMVLGQIRWFGRWRQYSFFPEPELVFEKNCLRQIANQCERATVLHRESKRT